MVEFTPEALEHVATNLKSADREEVHATVGHRRYADALRVSVAAADSVRVAINAYGEPMALLGVGTLSLVGSVGCPWLLTTDRARGYKRALMSLGKAYTAAMLRRYATLENHVHSGNVESVAWLQRLGFLMDAAAPYGALAHRFHRFSIRR